MYASAQSIARGVFCRQKTNYIEESLRKQKTAETMLTRSE